MLGRLFGEERGDAITPKHPLGRLLGLQPINMKMKDAPFKCPQCSNTDVVEVSDGVVTKHFYKWNGKTGKFVFRFEDDETFGNIELQCDSCSHTFDKKQYDKFVKLVGHS